MSHQDESELARLQRVLNEIDALVPQSHGAASESLSAVEYIVSLRAERDDARAALSDICYIGNAWLTPSSDQVNTAMRQCAEAALGRLNYRPVALSEAVKALTRSSDSTAVTLRQALQEFVNMRLFVEVYDGRAFDRARILAAIDRAQALLTPSGGEPQR